jgi:hypothetical protein
MERRFHICCNSSLVFRQQLDPRVAAIDVLTIKADIESGVLGVILCDWAAVHAEAERLTILVTEMRQRIPQRSAGDLHQSLERAIHFQDQENCTGNR